MKVEDDIQFHPAIEEQAPSRYQRKLIGFLRQLLRILFNLTLLIGVHVLGISILFALFQQTWQNNSLPFWQLVGMHILEQNVICLGIGLLFFNLIILDN